MTDFGRRSLVDEAFNEQYQHELKLFCEKILADDAFAETFGDLGPWVSMAALGKNGRVYRSNQSDRHDQNDAGFSPSDRLRMES